MLDGATAGATGTREGPPATAATAVAAAPAAGASHDPSPMILFVVPFVMREAALANRPAWTVTSFGRFAVPPDG